jgi:hypothetical protein
MASDRKKIRSLDDFYDVYPGYKGMFKIEENWPLYRESERQNSGEIVLIRTAYPTIPWPIDLPDYFHCCVEGGGLISYFPTKEHLVQDRRVIISPGRFLTKNTSWSGPKVAEVAGEFLPADFKIAESPEDITNVYLNGPNSCMTNKGWKADIHPVRAYAGEFGAAYLSREGSKKVSARCIVHLPTKVWVRAYGSGVLRKELEQQGFKKEAKYPAGARLTRLNLAGHTDRVYVPYIDGELRTLRPEKDALILTPGGSIFATDAGWADLKEIRCWGCGNRYKHLLSPISSLDHAGYAMLMHTCNNCRYHSSLLSIRHNEIMYLVRRSDTFVYEQNRYHISKLCPCPRGNYRKHPRCKRAENNA